MASADTRDDAIALLGRLVAFDTTSARSNLALIRFIEDFFLDLGIATQLTASEDGQKASLFATIGPSKIGGIALSAHSDCVPVTGQAWSSAPFRLTGRGDKLYGRGTCDMKGFLACVLAAAPSFKTARLRTPIHIAVSYDEEIGCTGVRPLIARLGRDLPKPVIAIVGEPTRMQVVDAHKSIDAFTTTVTGREAHSSMPQRGVNAIQYAAALIAELSVIADSKKIEGQERFDPPYSTLQVGTIVGGTATNIVPNCCRFDWQSRSIPGYTTATDAQRELEEFAERELLPAMRAVDPKAGIETLHLNHVPGLAARVGSAAVELALRLSGKNDTRAVSYATEAGLFEQAGIESVICGPGDIAQAHAADEYIEVGQIDACLAFLDRLTEHASAS